MNKTSGQAILDTGFYPQPLRAVWVLPSPMVSGRMGGHSGRGVAVWQVGGWQENSCPGCILKFVRCKMSILGMGIG